MSRLFLSQSGNFQHLTYFKLGVSSSLDVAIHVDLVVVGLVHLDDEGLKSCVFVTFQLLHQRLIGRGGLILLRDQSRLISEDNRSVDNWQIILKDHTIDLCVVLQLVVRFCRDGHRCVHFTAQSQLQFLSVRQILIVANRSLSKHLTGASIQALSETSSHFS